MYGINISNITTLGPNIPAHSYHQAIVFVLDLAKFFSSTYSDVASPSPCLLTSGNQKSYETYLSSILEQVKIHKLDKRVQHLLDKATQSPDTFSKADVKELNMIDTQLTEFMLSAERKGCKCCNQWEFWSPLQRETARNFSYWKQKFIMGSKKLIDWSQLNRLLTHIQISDADHTSLDPNLIYTRETEARTKWKACKKRSAAIR